MNRGILTVIVIFVLLYILKGQVTFAEWIELNTAFWYVFSRGIIIPSEKGYNRLAKNNDPVYTELFKRLNKEYGKVVKSYVYFQDMTFILDAELEQTILLYSPEYFGPGKFKKNVFKQFMNKNLGVVVDDEWKLTRRFNEHILEFKNDNPRDIISIVNRSILKYLSRPPLNVQDFIYLADRIAFTITFGNIPYNDVVYTIIKESQSSLSLHGYDNIKTDTRTEFEKLVQSSLRQPNNVNCLMKRVIGQRIIDPTKEMNYEIIRDQVLHWIFPARSIVLFSVPIFMTLILSDLNIYQLLKEEAMNNPPEHMLNSKNTYLHVCILEMLRLYNLVITLLRTSRGSIRMCDTEFRKGENLFMLFPYLLRSEKYFINPNKFYPNRFRESDMLKKHPNFPFSVGPQTCPGIDISMIMIKMMILHLFRWNYRLESESDKVDLDNTPYGINVYKTKFSVV